MKKKVFYWSPHLNPVGTVKSTLNSALSLKKYSNEYEVYLINVCGEWNDYENFLSNNSINQIKLSFSYFKFLPKRGFYLVDPFIFYFFIIIYSVSYFIKNKPDIIFLHLITSYH